MTNQLGKHCLSMLIPLLIAQGVSSFELPTGSNAGAGDLISLSVPSATGLVELPIGSLCENSVAVETGYIRQFEIKELDQLFVAVALQRTRFGLAIGLVQMGQTDFYAEQSAKAMLSYFHDSMTVGVSLSLLQVDAGPSFDRISAAGVGVGVSYKRNRVMAAFTADDINSPRLHKDAVAFNPRYTISVEILSLQSYSVFGRGRLEKTEKPSFALGQRFDVSNRGSVYWFVSTEALQYGAGIQVKQANMRLAYSLSYHPTLNLSHSISFAYLFSSDEKMKTGK